MRWIVTLSMALAFFASNVQQPVTVSAAISLSNALEPIAKAYADAGGDPIRFNFAGSNVLARQLVNGAPADVFISADEAQMDTAARAGAIDNTSRVDLLGNRLAIIAPPRPAAGSPIRGVDDLLRPQVKRI